MPGGAGGSTTQNSNQYTAGITTNNVPDWVSQASQGNLAVAQGINAKGFDPARDASVAGLNAQETVPGQIVSDFANSGGVNANYDASLGATQGLLGYQPQQVTPQTVGTTDVAGNTDAIQGAMSPYISDVIDASNKAGMTALQQTHNLNDSNAVAAKAFGGSRADLINSAADAQYALGQNQTAANLYNTGYQQATGLLSSDAARNLQADTTTAGLNLQGQQANQSAGLQGAGLVNTAAGTNASIAGQKQAGILGATGAENTYGQQEQQNAQQKLDAATGNADKSYATSQANLQSLIAALSGAQYSTWGTNNSNTQSSRTTQSSPDWATAALGAGRLAANFIPGGSAVAAAI